MNPPYLRKPAPGRTTHTFSYGELEITYIHSPSEDPDRDSGYPGCDSSVEITKINVGRFIEVTDELTACFKDWENLRSMCHNHYLTTIRDDEDEDTRY